MIKKNQELLNRLNAVSDGIIIYLMIPVAFWLRFSVLSGGKVNMTLEQYLIIGIYYAVVQVFLFAALGLYKPFRHIRVGIEAITDIPGGYFLVSAKPSVPSAKISNNQNRLR